MYIHLLRYENRKNLNRKWRRLNITLPNIKIYANDKSLKIQIVSCSVVSDSVILWTEPTRLLCPWDSPCKNTVVGCHSLLQGIFPTQGWTPGLLQGDSSLSELPGNGWNTLSKLNTLKSILLFSLVKIYLILSFLKF